MNYLTNPFHPSADWRVSIYGTEGEIVWGLYVANLILSVITTIVYSGLLYYLVIVKRRPIYKFEDGVFKPRPMEAYVASVTIFIIGRTVFCAMMISGTLGYGVVSNEGYIMEAFHEWPWGFGYGGIALYLIGIIFATPETINDPTMAKIYLPSGLQMNIFTLLMVVLPAILANTLAGIAGHYFDTNNMDKALKLTAAHYWIWALWSFFLMLAFCFFGRQLNRLLAANISQMKQKASGGRIDNLEAARRKLLYVTATLIAILASYVFAIVAYATCQRQILMLYAPLSILFCVLWNFCAPVLMVVVSAFIIYGIYKTDINPAPARKATIKSGSGTAESAGQGTSDGDKSFGGPAGSVSRQCPSTAV